jgi:hypothetical protein
VVSPRGHRVLFPACLTSANGPANWVSIRDSLQREPPPAPDGIAFALGVRDNGDLVSQTLSGQPPRSLAGRGACTGR